MCIRDRADTTRPQLVRPGDSDLLFDTPPTATITSPSDPPTTKACRGNAGKFLPTGYPELNASTRSRPPPVTPAATLHGEKDNNERTGSSHRFHRELN